MSTTGSSRGEYQYREGQLPILNKLARYYQNRDAPYKKTFDKQEYLDLWGETHLIIKEAVKLHEQGVEARTLADSLQTKLTQAEASLLEALNRIEVLDAFQGDDQLDDITGPALSDNTLRTIGWGQFLIRSIDKNPTRANRLYRRYWSYLEPWLDNKRRLTLKSEQTEKEQAQQIRDLEEKLRPRTGDPTIQQWKEQCNKLVDETTQHQSTIHELQQQLGRQRDITGKTELERIIQENEALKKQLQTLTGTNATNVIRLGEQYNRVTTAEADTARAREEVKTLEQKLVDARRAATTREEDTRGALANQARQQARIAASRAKRQASKGLSSYGREEESDEYADERDPASRD
jgi:hypothetical protein